MTARLATLRSQFDAADVIAVVITNRHNLRYLTGFTGSNGTLVVTADRAVLVTDSRYAERAPADLDVAGTRSSVDVRITRDTDDALTDLLDADAPIGLEADDVTWAALDRLQGRFNALHPTSGLVERQREVKDEGEIRRIAEAAAVADAALADAREKLTLEPTEREFAQVLDDAMRRHGADRPGFETIVAAGTNASRPHHAPGDRRIVAGDLVIVDMGAELDGYRSDMTRSFVIGTPTARQRDLLDAVLEAQAKGIATAGPGVPAASVDRACRAHLESAGLGDAFHHGAGHGVGLAIHEAPSVNAKSTATLAPGHVITVEPGAYLPDFGGVRWEDTVLITETGAEALTRSPKEPIVG